MKKNIEIIHNNGNEYLDEFLTKLPTNCLFDKGKTGCGGTTLAIKNDVNTIIVMPFVNLIKNKLQQSKDPDSLLCVFGKQGKGEIQPATNDEIIEYVTTRKKQKILVTYDSFQRLISVIKQTEVNPFEKYFLLIDEWHILFNSYVFRNRAIKGLLETSQHFESVTFMTATPIEDEFLLEEVKHLPVVKVEWDNVTIVTMKTEHTYHPLRFVKALVKQRLENNVYGNLHFFVNSVDFISSVINGLEIEPSLVKVVCSKQPNKGKAKSNQEKLGEQYKIEEPLSPVKPINFYTSTCFEGCDIYDEEGKTYLISDKHKQHTLYDISTLAIQICGRIRNNLSSILKKG